MRPPGAAAGTGEVTRNHAAAVNLTTGALLPWNPNVNGTVRALRVVGTTVYMAAYDAFLHGRLEDHELPEAEIERALRAIEPLPKPATV